MDQQIAGYVATFVESILDRLPPVFTTLYNLLPSYNKTSFVLTKLYYLTSKIPFLPFLLSAIAVYVTLYTVIQTARSTIRATGTIMKYSAIFGMLATGYNYLTSNGNAAPGNANNPLGRRGSSFWNNRPTRDYPANRNEASDWTSTLLSFLSNDAQTDGPSANTRSSRRRTADRQPNADNPAMEGLKFVAGLFTRGDSLVNGVWNQVKNAVDQAMNENATPVNDRRRRNRRG